jgi:lipopolysaccharide export system protein LptA
MMTNFTSHIAVLLAAGLLATPVVAQGSSASSKAMSAQAHANQPAAAAPAQGSAASGPPNALQGFSQNQGKPIHIDAAKLEVRDKDKVATFSGDAKTGDVKVVQGDTIMRSKTLVVFYEQSAGAAQSDKAAPAAAPGPGGSQQIRRLEARGNVIVTQNEQTVTGDNGIFDTKANTVTMKGNVIMTQGKNVMKGKTLVVDLTTGVSRFENDGGRVDAVFFPQSGQQPGVPGGAPAAPTSSGGAGKPMTLNGIGGGQGR